MPAARKTERNPPIHANQRDVLRSRSFSLKSVERSAFGSHIGIPRCISDAAGQTDGAAHHAEHDDESDDAAAVYHLR